MHLPDLQTLTREIRNRVAPLFATTARSATRKPDGSLLTATDQAIQQHIAQLLHTLTPEIPLLGEEMSLQQQQAAIQNNSRCWVLDPLDGTSNFATGIPFYALSLALIEAGESQLAIVYDPNRNECFSAQRQRGAWCNETPLHTPPPPPLARCIGLIDGKRLSPQLAHALHTSPPCHSIRNFGAVALEWCWLAAGRGAIYLHGGQQLWDYAAAQLILREAGGAACDLHGTPPEPLYLGTRGMIAAATPALLDQWQQWIAQQHAASQA